MIKRYAYYHLAERKNTEYARQIFCDKCAEYWQLKDPTNPFESELQWCSYAQCGTLPAHPFFYGYKP